MNICHTAWECGEEGPEQHPVWGTACVKGRWVNHELSSSAEAGTQPEEAQKKEVPCSLGSLRHSQGLSFIEYGTKDLSQISKVGLNIECVFSHQEN